MGTGKSLTPAAPGHPAGGGQPKLTPIAAPKDIWGGATDDYSGYATAPMEHPHGKYGPVQHSVSSKFGEKKVDGTAKAVYHNGVKIGHVASTAAYKDGPNIGGHVVAWRKNVVHHTWSPTPESGIGHQPYYIVGGHTSQAEAIRSLIRAHKQVKK